MLCELPVSRPSTFTLFALSPLATVTINVNNDDDVRHSCLMGASVEVYISVGSARLHYVTKLFMVSCASGFELDYLGKDLKKHHLVS